MKSFRKLLPLIIFCIGIYSCSTSSSASDDLHSNTLSGTFPHLSPEAIVYASSISNLISTFPKFRNDAVNREVSLLKNALTDYLNSVRISNNNQKQNALYQVETYYKKIQKLRKFLVPDDDEVLNRYLVRIKTNMNLLEASITTTKEEISF